MPLYYWAAIIIFLLIPTTVVVLMVVKMIETILNLRDEHHYDNQDPDGSCDPMDDKLDEYDND